MNYRKTMSPTCRILLQILISVEVLVCLILYTTYQKSYLSLNIKQTQVFYGKLGKNMII